MCYINYKKTLISEQVLFLTHTTKRWEALMFTTQYVCLDLNEIVTVFILGVSSKKCWKRPMKKMFV